jgi:hypothetical protein
MGRHWSLGLAASVQLPTCVHPRACGLGPLPEPVIHRSAAGHMPPDDFFNDVDAGARPTRLRPHAQGKPYAWVTGPCGTGQPHTRSSGVKRARSSHHTLEGACQRPRGFSPTRLYANTRCRSTVPISARKTPRSAVQQGCDASCEAPHEPSVLKRLQSPHAKET